MGASPRLPSKGHVAEGQFTASERRTTTRRSTATAARTPSFPSFSGAVQRRLTVAMIHSSDSATESGPRPMSNAMRSEKTSIEVQVSDHRKTLIDQENPDRQEETKKKGRKARPTLPTLTTQRHPISHDPLEALLAPPSGPI